MGSRSVGSWRASSSEAAACIRLEHALARSMQQLPSSERTMVSSSVASTESRANPSSTSSAAAAAAAAAIAASSASAPSRLLWRVPLSTRVDGAPLNGHDEEEADEADEADEAEAAEVHGGPPLACRVRRRGGEASQGLRNGSSASVAAAAVVAAELPCPRRDARFLLAPPSPPEPGAEPGAGHSASSAASSFRRVVPGALRSGRRRSWRISTRKQGISSRPNSASRSAIVPTCSARRQGHDGTLDMHAIAVSIRERWACHRRAMAHQDCHDGAHGELPGLAARDFLAVDESAVGRRVGDEHTLPWRLLEPQRALEARDLPEIVKSAQPRAVRAGRLGDAGSSGG